MRVSPAHGEVHGRRGRLRSLRLAGLEIPDLETVFIDPHSGAEIGPLGVDGTLGIWALSRFNVVVDYTGRRLFLKPRGADGGGFEEGGRQDDPRETVLMV